MMTLIFFQEYPLIDLYGYYTDSVWIKNASRSAGTIENVLSVPLITTITFALHAILKW